MLHTVDLSDTIVALATPPGVGAIGVIRLSGKEAITIVNEVFPGKDLAKEASHTIHFGTIRDGDKIVDEVLASLFIAPRSYTGENVVEVSCHGSEYIIQKLMELFVRHGARPAEAGEFTMRAFLNGQMDLSQAEAVADLIASSSASSHTIAMQQMRGGFSHEIAQLRQELMDFASLIELELDFSEEDVEFANRDALEKLVKKIRTLLKALIDSFQLGNVLKNGVNTVIAGRPNAGKSTLLNAILKEERAIVSHIAGTTRDTIEEVFNIRGINFRLIDTAGIRDARDQIEAVGVEKTFEKISQSAILIYVFDVVETSPEEVKEDLAKLSTPGLIILGAANKMDLNPYTKAEHYTNEYLPAERFVPISAKNNMNLGLLKDRLYENVVSGDLNTDSTIVSNTRHYAALQKAYESLDAVLAAMHSGITSDFIAMDIRQALHHLGTITGEISTEDLLGNIFGRFCIGK
ncbi:MAG: tRNA uridine-5-carboxymethylaminomethyl(34) synthesis GTPase MnmE [Saprospiraceae bacterium]|nr:tRNA uridine-5-carboxymethylaminomethyl(34) synthesis GTPase MnmE [Saprospiraceae bacterium]MCB9324371.1 tRNA uridine-5-carboxymethylaminomethyl(34) synthesis GTPase MnmE [Lewinellaceae bacterium]